MKKIIVAVIAAIGLFTIYLLTPSFYSTGKALNTQSYSNEKQEILANPARNMQKIFQHSEDVLHGGILLLDF